MSINSSLLTLLFIFRFQTDGKILKSEDGHWKLTTDLSDLLSLRPPTGAEILKYPPFHGKLFFDRFRLFFSKKVSRCHLSDRMSFTKFKVF